jgi:hypothetical protein
VSLRRAAAPAAAAACLACALPALAYLLPAPAIAKRSAEKRAGLDLVAVEATGTLEARGAAASRLGPAGPAGVVTGSARLLVKVPGKSRLELTPADVPDAERPFVAVRDDRLSGQGGPETAPAAAALVRALATLLGSPTGAEGKALLDGLARRGVRLDVTSLGRADGRVTWVLGGSARRGQPYPAAAFDKDSFLPVRLVLLEGGTLYEVRLVDWGSPTGGDWFPRAVEVWEGEALVLRFTTEKAGANPRLPDALF